jgi:hypothetical protein
MTTIKAIAKPCSSEPDHGSLADESAHANIPRTAKLEPSTAAKSPGAKRKSKPV